MDKPIERSWPNGPLRQCHVSHTALNWRYVCDQCLRPVHGIYFVRDQLGNGSQWLCSECNTQAKDKRPQPESSRSAQDAF